MGNPNKVAPNDVVKLYFDDDDDDRSAGLSEEDAASLQAEMDAMNKALKKKAKRRKK
jgi:hypothetical protein